MGLGNVAGTKNNGGNSGRRQGSRLGSIGNRHDFVLTSHLVNYSAQSSHQFRFAFGPVPIERQQGGPWIGKFERKISFPFYFHEFRKLTKDLTWFFSGDQPTINLNPTSVRH